MAIKDATLYASEHRRAIRFRLTIVGTIPAVLFKPRYVISFGFGWFVFESERLSHSNDNSNVTLVAGLSRWVEAPFADPRGLGITAPTRWENLSFENGAFVVVAL
jgi:hypothetical protein